MAGAFAAGLRQMRGQQSAGPPADDPLADWHPFDLRNKPADHEAEAAPVVAPAYSISAMAEEYRRCMAASEDAPAATMTPAG